MEMYDKMYGDSSTPLSIEMAVCTPVPRYNYFPYGVN